MVEQDWSEDSLAVQLRENENDFFDLLFSHTVRFISTEPSTEKHILRKLSKIIPLRPN